MGLKKIILILVIAFLIITIIGAFYIDTVLPSRSETILQQTKENEARIAFFADPHITDSKEGAETDFFLGTSYEIPRDAKTALNHTSPDYIFGLGDLTAHTETEEWIGYKKWISDLNAPVYDLLGNHDRDHYPGIGNYGTGYFTEIKRVSGTKVLKLGNNVFMLISEDHDPEGDGDSLASTIPDKRFEFIEKYLQKYSENNNIFIMNHVQLSGTAAYSDTWFLGKNPNWIHITNKLMSLLQTYEVEVHMSGHIHTDYRMKDKPGDWDKTEGVENIEKFVSGTKINQENRKYPPENLPNTYFLNLPVVDYAHGWFGVRFPILHQISGSLESTEASSGLKWWAKHEDMGIPILDSFHNPRNSYFLGRGAIYHFTMKENSENLDMITRWIGGDKDVENYKITLTHPIRLDNKNMQFIASDLSLRKKENLTITRDNWFKIKPGTHGSGIFSKKYKKSKNIRGLSIKNYNLKNYSVKWQRIENKEKTRDNNWYEDPEKIGKTNSLKIKIKFEAPSSKEAFIEDISILENSAKK